MASSKVQKVWLMLLGGKPVHAGLGITTLASIFTVIGAIIAGYGSSALTGSSLYWLGYAIVAIGMLGGLVGIIYHRVLSKRYTRSRSNAA